MLAANLSLTTLFGANVVKTGAHPNTTLTIKLSDLGSFDDTSALTGEGIILALLQHLQTNQGSDATRVLEATSSTVLNTKGGDPTLGQSFQVRLYSSASLPPVDPDYV